MNSDLHFDRYRVGNLISVAAICRDRGPGIYVLEFSNGEEYVGQTLSFGRRLWQHKHGGKHHEPWGDIVAMNLMEVPVEKLDEIERLVIATRRKAGVKLRNKTYNFGHEMSSPFDVVFPVVQRTHWVNGETGFDLESLRQEVTRPAGEEPKLFKSPQGRRAMFPEEDEYPAVSVAQGAVAALGRMLAYIPRVTELEGQYWTVSDYPSTAGGRLLTLNVGRLELFYIPRETVEYRTENGDRIACFEAFINFPAGTFLPETTEDGFQEICLYRDVTALASRSNYPLIATDTLCVPMSQLIFDTESWGLEEALRGFILDLMIDGPSGIFRRWHSPELARRAYEFLISDF